ncbi:MAG: hypothetical protein CL432_02610 [Acidimicrobiaceae bacterium]|nr:hypothetical protein [Acidimicrobiaceae bacterium]
MVKSWFFTIGFILLVTFLNVWKVSAQSSNTPDSPTNFQAIGGNETLTINWGVPLNNGGSTITGYQFNWNGVDRSGMAIISSLSTVLESLTNGASYSLSVAAINSNGVGSSTETVIGVPYTSPNPPSSLSAKTMDGVLVLNWDAPGFNGGSPVFGYRIESREIGSDFWKVEIANTGFAFTTHNIVNFEFDVSKEFQISAINQAGMSLMSESLIFEAQTQAPLESTTTTTQIDNVTTTTLPVPSTCTTVPPQSTTPADPVDTESTFSEIETVGTDDYRIPPTPIYVC